MPARGRRRAVLSRSATLGPAPAPAWDVLYDGRHGNLDTHLSSAPRATSEALAELLRLEGFTVRASGAQSAAGRRGAWQPDLVIADVAFPQTDGLVLLHSCSPSRCARARSWCRAVLRPHSTRSV